MFSCKDLEDYVANSTSALELKFVRKEADIFDDGLAFSPSFTHQVFGEKETVFGYKNLKIQVYYTPAHLHTYIDLTYDDEVEPSRHQGLKPDNIIKTLAEYIPEGFTTNLDEFTARLSRPTEFRPFGELLHSYSCCERTYQVYKAGLTCPGFGAYLQRLQTFLLWFIDAASFVDPDDEKWSFYLLFEKSTENGEVQYAIVGYTTVYNFYAYPDKIRPRISQMLILPPYQRKGHGAQLLQTVYDTLVPLPQVHDITVEDPSEEFSVLRDFVDCRNALQLECFRPPIIHQPFEGEIQLLCRQKLKLNKRQGQRVHEILRLKATDRSNSEQYRNYRLTVKNRLNGPYQREQRDLQKLKRVMDPAELALTHPPVSHEDHMTQLHKEYKQLEAEYLAVIEKLAATPTT